MCYWVLCLLKSFIYPFFFFSSRRRHTRLQGDWSSDVCSSDLSELAEREGAGVGDLDGSGDRIGEARKQPGHLGGGLEMPLGIDREPKTRFRDRAFLADTSDDVGELPALGH